MRRSLLVLASALVVALGATGCESQVTTDSSAANARATAPGQRPPAAAGALASAFQARQRVVTRVLGATSLDDAAHDALKRELLDALNTAQTRLEFVPREGTARDVDDTLASLRFTMLPADGGEREVRFTFELELDFAGRAGQSGGALRVDVDTHIERRDDESRDDFRRRAVQESGATLATAAADAVRVRHGSIEELVEVLTRPGQRDALLLDAIREAGRRGDARAEPALRDLLVHPSRDVVLVALVMLGQLGQEASVGAIRELLMSPDTEKFAEALRAMGKIGGPDAEAAVTEIARNHPEPAVREIAGQILLEMVGRD